MRIAIDVSSLASDHRGMGFFVRKFIFNLSKMSGTHFDVVLTTEKPLNESFPYKVVKPQSLDRSWLFWFPFNHPSYSIDSINSIPENFVVTIHDFAPFIFKPTDPKLQKKYLEGAKRASRIIVDSRFIEKEAHDLLPVDPNKISVVSLGFDPTEFQQNLLPPLSSPYLLSVGPAEPRKNFEVLLHAFQRLQSHLAGYKLVIVGELPPWRKKIGPIVFETQNPLPGIAKKLKIDGDVLFTGPISHTNLSGWYKNSALVAIPSLYEGFGFPVLEAYSLGTPVACSNAASLPEVAGNGAFFFNPHHAEEMASTMEYALTHPEVVKQKKELATQHLAHFSWENCVTNYLKIFAQVVE